MNTDVYKKITPGDYIYFPAGEYPILEDKYFLKKIFDKPRTICIIESIEYPWIKVLDIDNFYYISVEKPHISLIPKRELG